MTGRPHRFAWLAAIALIVASTASACGASEPVITAEPNSPTIGARDTKFDRSELHVPAGRAFTLVFDNQDGASHNVAIYRDAAMSQSVFGGSVFGGPATRVYAVPQLTAGTYYFRCDVHHEMQGTVVAG